MFGKNSEVVLETFWVAFEATYSTKQGGLVDRYFQNEDSSCSNEWKLHNSYEDMAPTGCDCSHI